MEDKSKDYRAEEMPISIDAIRKEHSSQTSVQSPCQDFCPISLNSHGYIALIEEGKLEEAYRLIRQRLPFPMTLGRICDKPCESSCRHALMDQAVAIKDLKRFVADYAHQNKIKYTPTIRSKRSERVAIIGAGPAGLAAAYDLAREGFNVTVFEALPLAGGMLAVGCPEFRLPLTMLQDEIENVTKLGVDIRVNSRVSDINSLFKDGYGAVFIATGCHTGRKPAIEGVDLDGVLVGVSLLRDIRLGKKVNLGRRALVLGGGGTAFDCARTCIRLGVPEVHIACVEQRENLPVDTSEIIAAEEEGIRILPLRTFTRILSKKRMAAGVECLNLRQAKFDKDGVLHMDVITGSEHVVEADTVIFAVGQVPDLNFFSSLVGLQITKRGTIAVDTTTLSTAIEGVFAGGDAVTNKGSVIRAIADGQKAAISITMYLNGEKPSATAKRRDDEFICLPSIVPSIEEIKKKRRVAPPLFSVESRRSSFSEAVLSYSCEEAVEQASRCLRCDLTHPAAVIRREGFGIRTGLDDLITRVRVECNPASCDYLRKALLHGLGIRRKHRTAETVIFFGCNFVFGMPMQTISSIKLLDHLGIEYTFPKDKEYCCGLQLVEWIGGEKADAASNEFMRMNLAEAQRLGGKKMVWLCQWCAYLAKRHLADQSVPQLYFLDLLCELPSLPPMRVQPTVIGYYEGCHLRRLSFAPGIELDWKGYRRILESIEGVKIVDLPHWQCCITDAEQIVEEALRKNVGSIICTCAACWTWVERIASRKGLPVRMLQDLIVEALVPKNT